MPTKVSRKTILPYLQEVSSVVVELRKKVESMPESTKKKSLMLSVVNIEKKVQVTVKEVTEEQAVDYIKNHPEVLAKFAASDEGAKEVSVQATKKRR